MFTVGQRVRISPSLDTFQSNELPGINQEMLPLAGQIDTITGFNAATNWVMLNGNNFAWNQRWLEPIVEPANSYRVGQKFIYRDAGSDLNGEKCMIATMIHDGRTYACLVSMDGTHWGEAIDIGDDYLQEDNFELNEAQWRSLSLGRHFEPFTPTIRVR